MSRERDLDDLLQITRARYQHRQQSFAKVIAEESRLRNELTRLDEMNRSTETPQTAQTEMRAIGADVIWLAWLGRAKSALNSQLARVLAVKENHLSEVRRAYGKVLVVEELQSKLMAEQRKTRREKALSDAVTQAVHRDL
ncbi:MAG: hypothetical protein WBB25_13845 [Sulfitobacter sp.]